VWYSFLARVYADRSIEGEEDRETGKREKERERERERESEIEREKKKSERVRK